MPRRRALSAKEVEAITKTGLTWVDDNLYLQRRDDGTRSWIFRYERDGKVRSMGLGAVSRVPLAKARQLAGAHRVALWDGADPVAEKKATRTKTKEALAASTAPTFRWCAEQVIVAREKFHKSRYAQQQWPSSMRDHVYPHIGNLPVDQVGLHEVHKVLAPIWQTKHPAAKKVRGRIATMLDWAAAKGYRPADNPARPNGPLDQLLPPVRHREKPHPSVPYQEVADVVARLRGMDSISAKALLFTILTGVRSGETRGAVWSEIDLDAKVWTIPPERTKTDDEYRIPLSEQAVALLKTLQRRGGLVFPNPNTKKPLSDMALMECLKGIRPGKSVHGFRATLSTWAREQTDYPAEVIEAALNHKQPDKVVAAYARTTYFDRRRALFEDWAGHCFGASAAAAVAG